MKTDTVIKLVTLGVMLVLGSGFLWYFTSYFDCSLATPDKKNACMEIKTVGSYGLIGVVIGFSILSYVCFVAKVENECENKDTTSKGPFSNNKGAI